MYIPSIYTVESVTSGHPDKVCDQISDAILDACLAEDPGSRVAVETFGSHGMIVIGGEVTSLARVNYEKIARMVYKDIGYEDEPRVLVNVSEQSSDIACGVDQGGAGDQGIMYGFATNETPEMLPVGVVLVHAMAKRLDTLRKNGQIPWLRPDGKTQVTMEHGRPTCILVSCQHDVSVLQNEIRASILEQIVKPILEEYHFSFKTVSDVFVNPTGSFVRGGFEADTGLTGRKIMVDTYGGLLPHGGGCFSGKDATKVDRCAAYMARFTAKQIVASGRANQCLVSVAYAIGKAEPLMLRAVDEQGKDLSSFLQEKAFNFRPVAIRETLGLSRPIFRQTAVYGHFGKSEFPWENSKD
ncbi:MAG: S-adenosylmethionine synthase [Candidatus Uhrbacteria bacterium GW2011_GWA2_41_10]|nr:MAG: S-adenosylmethionine synthase [Candidatus Uhrbacteria bacterium GW2011_GWA2_41_10]